MTVASPASMRSASGYCACSVFASPTASRRPDSSQAIASACGCAGSEVWMWAAVSRWTSAACAVAARQQSVAIQRSEEHTSELQSLMRISYAVFCLKKKNKTTRQHEYRDTTPKNKISKRLHD